MELAVAKIVKLYYGDRKSSEDNIFNLLLTQLKVEESKLELF
jgi:hypothetical protein